MHDKLNVLFISPFESMREVVMNVIEDYSDFNLTLEIGNEYFGQQIAKNHYYGNYDCIISRGNTASLIREVVSVPVIDIQISMPDIIQSLSAIPKYPKVIAAVGYNSIVSKVKHLKHYLPFELKVFGYDIAEDLKLFFEQIAAAGINTVVCDAFSFEYAKQLGMDAYVLQSGEYSIRSAFDHVRFLYSSNLYQLEENQLLRRLVSSNNEVDIVVFSVDKKLYYSTLSASEQNILDILIDNLSQFQQYDKFKIVKQRSGYLYRISAQTTHTNNKTYYTYYISRKIPSISSHFKSIKTYTATEIRQEIENSVFGIINLTNYYSSEVDRTLLRNTPVLIYGDVGVGKNHLAETIYLNSKYKNNPLIIIDCSLINQQTWDYLLNKEESPLCDNENTLYIKNIDAVNDKQLRQLLAALIFGEVIRRNRLLISCSSTRGLSQITGVPVLKIINQLGCYVISMTSLNGQFGTIEKSVNLLLEDFRKRNNPNVGDISDDAISLLVHYNWPQNFDQLIRVVSKAATIALNGPISKEIVTEVLKTEMRFAQGETIHTSNTLLNLTKSLEEINCDIAHIILEQNGGNQSDAAKSLGISRTTLWRMLKNCADLK